MFKNLLNLIKTFSLIYLKFIKIYLLYLHFNFYSDLLFNLIIIQSINLFNQFFNSSLLVNFHSHQNFILILTIFLIVLFSLLTHYNILIYFFNLLLVFIIINDLKNHCLLIYWKYHLIQKSLMRNQIKHFFNLWFYFIYYYLYSNSTN